MKIKIQIIFLFFIGLFFSCSTDNNEMPNQEVNKEFIVGIDGKTTSFSDNIITDYSSFYHHDYALRASIYNNSKLVVKVFDSITHQSITLTVGYAFSNKPLIEGSYEIGMPNGEYPITNIYYDNNNILGDNDEYFFNKNHGCHLTGSQIVGEVIISEIDKSNKRVKGFFKGSLFGWVYDEDSAEYFASSVNLANGRFDLPYTDRNDFKKNTNIDKGVFEAKITHEDRDFTFLPTDGAVTGVGTRHFRVRLKMNDSGEELSEIYLNVENENFGVLKIKYKNSYGIDTGLTYNFYTDLSLNFFTLDKYLYFADFYYNTGHVSSPLPIEKNDSHITILSLNKEEKIIEGTFGVNNSTRGINITNGYFKVKYDEI